MPPTPPPPPNRPGGPHRQGPNGFQYSPGDYPPPQDRYQWERSSKTWGMLCHLSSLCIFLGVPFGNVAGPLLVWLLKRDEFPYVDEQGKESLNFQICLSIYYIVAAMLIFVFVGFLLLPLLGLFQIIAVIVASVRANDGRPIRYPLTIRFLK